VFVNKITLDANRFLGKNPQTVRVFFSVGSILRFAIAFGTSEADRPLTFFCSKVKKEL
jgi:hypothetical protein